MSLPEAFSERLEKIVPREHFNAIIQTFDTPKRVTFRFNPLKTTPSELEAELARDGIVYERVGWDILEGVYRINPEDKLRLTQTSAFY
jgi:16S rRNA C967 or C1407 C5-methylase (RsmB/RsmF family)